jgi:hypothetical protein
VADHPDQPLSSSAAAADNETLEARLARLESELGGLRLKVVPERDAWWRQVPVVVSVAVSVFSVLFSLATWLASERRTALERINQDRAELRETLRRLSDLDRRMARIDIEFKELPAEARGSVGAGMTTEYAMLASAALQLVRGIPTGVTPTEKAMLAAALLNSGEEDAAQALILDAVADPRGGNVIEKVSTIRALANVRFAQGELDDARALLARADAIVAGSTLSRGNRAMTLFSTAMIWARGELSVGACARARDRLDAARAVIAGDPDVFGPRLHDQVAELADRIAACGGEQPPS